MEDGNVRKYTVNGFQFGSDKDRELAETEYSSIQYINGKIEKVNEDTKECNGYCKCEEKVDKDDVEVMANQLALNEEMIRQENLYDKEFNASEETKNTEIYQEMIIMAESVVAGLRVLVSGGVDYNNALQLCSNQIQNRQNLELAKYNCVVNQGQNQI